MADVKIGVAGFGARGLLAGQAHRPGHGSRVVAVADPAETARARAAKRFGPDAAVLSDPRQLLAADIDAALVLAPDDAHEAVACDLLAAGVPTYVEKPLAITAAGCDRILRAGRDHRARLYVGHNMRHMPVVRLMRDLVHGGEIGEVKAVWCRHFVGHGGDFYYKDWHADRRRTTSLLVQKGAHDIDVIHWLAGAYTARVAAMGDLVVYGQIADRRDDDGSSGGGYSLDNWPPLAQRGLNPVVDVEDLSMVTMALDSGAFATYSQCHFTPDYWRNYTVIGTEGRIENFGDLSGDVVVRLWNRRTRYNPDGDAEFPVRNGAIGTHGGADRAIIDEFLDFVRHGGATETSPIAARQSVATAEMAATSLRDRGAPRDVPPLDRALADYYERGQAGTLGLMDPGGISQ